MTSPYDLASPLVDTVSVHMVSPQWAARVRSRVDRAHVSGIDSGWRHDSDTAMLCGWMQLSCENSSRH